jgi:hypothetical protein
MDRIIKPDYIKIYDIELYLAISYPNKTFYRSPNYNLVYYEYITWKKELMHKMSLYI